jgi:hypothetical protein
MPSLMTFDVQRAGYAEQFVQRLGEMSRQTLNEILVEMTDDIAAHAPVGKKADVRRGTMHLSDSFYHIPAQEISPGVLEGYIASRLAIRARVQEYGSGLLGPKMSDYPITPKQAKALVFYWENGPYGPRIYHFAKVSHPGVWGQFYINETLRTWRPALAQKFGEAIKLAAEAPNIPGGRGFTA